MKKVLMGFLVLAVSGCGTPPSEKAQTSGGEQQMSQPAKTDYIQKGMAQLKQADLPAAIKSFDEAIKQSPKELKGYIILGQTYMRIKDYDRAIDTFSAAARVAPDQGEVYYMLAVNCNLAGKKQDAIKNAEKGLELFRRKKDEANFRKTLLLLQSLSQPAQKETDS